MAREEIEHLPRFLDGFRSSGWFFLDEQGSATYEWPDGDRGTSPPVATIRVGVERVVVPLTVAESPEISSDAPHDSVREHLARERERIDDLRGRAEIIGRTATTLQVALETLASLEQDQYSLAKGEGATSEFTFEATPHAIHYAPSPDQTHTVATLETLIDQVYRTDRPRWQTDLTDEVRRLEVDLPSLPWPPTPEALKEHYELRTRLEQSVAGVLWPGPPPALHQP